MELPANFGVPVNLPSTASLMQEIWTGFLKKIILKRKFSGKKKNESEAKVDRVYK